MSLNNKKVFIDASLFMGMHSENTRTRRQSIEFMAQHFNGQVYMNLEQVGMCDEYVWQYERDIQDAYYPFMDVLHSEMDVKRIGYSQSDLNLSLLEHGIDVRHLTVQQRLLMAQVINHEGLLFTHDSHIRSNTAFHTFLGEFQSDDIALNEQGDRETPVFTPALDELYETSKRLVFPFTTTQEGNEHYV